MAALALCLAAGLPYLYLWLVLGCGLALLPLELRREYRAVRRREVSLAPRLIEPDATPPAAPGINPFLPMREPE
jgi:hypothetical protein